MAFDPFGDYETAGYLRNVFGEKDLRVVKDLENSAFKMSIADAVFYLADREISYENVLQTHRILFKLLYPWAGEPRSINAQDIAISKAGYDKMFCHPSDVERSLNYALSLAKTDPIKPGQIYAELAHAHPFLDGNGRTILTIHSEIMRQNGFHVEWEKTHHNEFLKVLTDDLHNPGKDIFEKYLSDYVKPQALTLNKIGEKLRATFKTSLP